MLLPILISIELQSTKLNPRKILNSPNNRAAILANFSNDVGDGNDNVKKGKTTTTYNNTIIKLVNQQLCTRINHAFFYWHFFDVIARLQRENA